VMRLYDTARQAVVPFEPGPVVTMYTCGITPYDATHLGHAATFMAYDIVQRRLRDLGHETRCVRNITDVDDPLLVKADQLGVHYLDLAAAEVARFQDDVRALEMIPCVSEPRATSAIPDIRGFIGMVLDRGHAYQAGGAVYFDVSTVADFGSVSHYSEDQMIAYARERGGNVEDPNKRHPSGRRCGAPAGRAGTSSAPRWRCVSSARRSTCTAAAPTSSSRTTSASGSRARQPRVSPSCATGCTWPWSAWTAPRCRRAWATWCSSTGSERSGTRG
jgi:tRNA synthetases class I (C) catalytic domain